LVSNIFGDEIWEKTSHVIEPQSMRTIIEKLHISNKDELLTLDPGAENILLWLLGLTNIRKVIGFEKDPFMFAVGRNFLDELSKEPRFYQLDIQERYVMANKNIMDIDRIPNNISHLFIYDKYDENSLTEKERTHLSKLINNSKLRIFITFTSPEIWQNNYGLNWLSYDTIRVNRKMINTRQSINAFIIRFL
jgi:hypothetical protein